MALTGLEENLLEYDVSTISNKKTMKKGKCLSTISDQQRYMEKIVMKNKDSLDRMSNEQEEMRKLMNEMNNTMNQMKAAISY